MPPCRKIASNLLLTPAGELLRNPLVELSAEGRIRAIRRLDAVDRSPFTEFYAGLLLPHLRPEAAARCKALLGDRTTPLTQLLRPLQQEGAGGLLLLAGLDYAQLTFTEQSSVRLLVP